MATARTSQAHDKRVQKIAEDAAAKIAADSPLEEEVVVVVEESPPGESARTQRGRRGETERAATETALGMVGQSQKLVADGISRWIEMTTAPFGTPTASFDAFGSLFDPRHVTRETFRLAEELLASQKEFALKVAEAMTPAKAA
jgi:hypothetical protein